MTNNNSTKTGFAWHKQDVLRSMISVFKSLKGVFIEEVLVLEEQNNDKQMRNKIMINGWVNTVRQIEGTIFK